MNCCKVAPPRLLIGQTWDDIIRVMTSATVRFELLSTVHTSPVSWLWLCASHLISPSLLPSLLSSFSSGSRFFFLLFCVPLPLLSVFLQFSCLQTLKVHRYFLWQTQRLLSAPASAVPLFFLNTCLCFITYIMFAVCISLSLSLLFSLFSSASSPFPSRLSAGRFLISLILLKVSFC